MPEPDYFKMAKDITDMYIINMKIIYKQGKIAGGAEVMSIVNKVCEEGKK